MTVVDLHVGRGRIVAILMVVLVAAAAARVLQLRTRAPVTTTESAEVPAGHESVERPNESVRYPSRNPFKTPAGFKTTSEETGVTGKESPTRAVPSSPEVMPWLPGERLQIEPIIPNPDAEQSMQTAQEPAEKAEDKQPKFTLVATVENGECRCGVIRIGDSEERVVGVGDIIEGGFRVKELEVSRAVLTNGRETIIAERPHPQDPSLQEADGT